MKIVGVMGAVIGFVISLFLIGFIILSFIIKEEEYNERKRKNNK